MQMNMKSATASGFRWLPSVLPPLLLLVFAFTPSFFLGLAALILLFVFIVSIISFLKKAANRQIEKDLRTRQLLRPGLAIIIVILNGVLLSSSKTQAEQFVIETARNMQKICLAKGQCPDSAAGFTCSDGICSGHAGLTAQYYIRYSLADDKQTFAVSIPFDMDTERTVSGGVRAPLTSSLYQRRE